MDVRQCRSIARARRPGRSNRAHRRARVDDRPTLSSVAPSPFPASKASCRHSRWCPRSDQPEQPRKTSEGVVSKISSLGRGIMSNVALGASPLRCTCSRESSCEKRRGLGGCWCSRHTGRASTLVPEHLAFKGLKVSRTGGGVKLGSTARSGAARVDHSFSHRRRVFVSTRWRRS